MKPLLLYTPIFSFTAELFVEKLLEVDSSEDQEFWINSPGGSVFAGNSILGALNERTGANNAKVFGSADSMVAYMLLYMDKVEALDVSTFRLHRADGFSNNDEDKALLAKVNKDLRSKMEQKIDAKVFKEITGHTFNEMFDSEKRIDIDLDAKQAKKIGLVDKIIRLEPKQIAAMNEQFVAFADFSGEVIAKAQGSEKQKHAEIKVEQIKKTTMTRDELKAQFPEIFTAIRNEGVNSERSRVNAIMKFSHIDLKACTVMVIEGKELGQEFMAEMTVKAISANQLKVTEQESDNPVAPGVEITAETKADLEEKKYNDDVREAAGLSKLEEVK